MPPTIYEIAGHFGIKAPTVSIHVKALARKNFIVRSAKARSISVSKSYSRFRRKPRPDTRAVPVLKDLSDFEKTMSEEFVSEQYVFLDAVFFKLDSSSRLFAMKMADSSMLKAGIVRDDIIVFDSRREPRPLDIVAASARTASFIRIYSPSDDGRTIELSEAGEKPRSATFPRKDVNVRGVMAGLIRRQSL